MIDKKAYQKMDYALCLLSAHADGKDSGCIINSFHQVTSSFPAKFTIAVNRENVTAAAVEQAGSFCVTLLAHDAPAALGAHITTRCYGYTASAATIIAQAASPGCREISANALYLIHTAVCATEGNAAELNGKLDLLRQTDARIAAVYAARSGRPAAEFETLMAENNGNGRWLSPEEAVAAGLADVVTDAAGHPAPSLTRNIARGWERLLVRIGLSAGEQLPADRNILHTEGEERELLRRSAAAVRQAQQRVVPTQTRPREDPSYGDLVRTANQRAYSEDAKRLRNM